MEDYTVSLGLSQSPIKSWNQLTFYLMLNVPTAFSFFVSQVRKSPTPNTPAALGWQKYLHGCSDGALWWINGHLDTKWLLFIEHPYDGLAIGLL